jgi:hypothetical protein
MTDAAENTQQSTLFVLSNRAQFEQLHSRINNQFKTNKIYHNSPNRIEIGDQLKLKISTKYYKLNLHLELVPLNTSQQELKSLLERFYSSQGFVLEGFLALLGNDVTKLDAELLENSLKLINNSDEKDQAETELEMNPNTRLNLFILNKLNEASSAFVEDLLGKYDDPSDYIQINLDLDADNNTPNVVEVSESDQEEEEEFSELDELINSLFVHSWSGLELIDPVKKIENKLENDSSTQQNLKESIAKVEADGDLEEESTEDTLANFGFENLLMNLTEMKEKADGMSFDERKKYAETVVVNFWKSIGGDMEEINGLDDDEDD